MTPGEVCQTVIHALQREGFPSAVAACAHTCEGDGAGGYRGVLRVWHAGEERSVAFTLSPEGRVRATLGEAVASA